MTYAGEVTPSEAYAALTDPDSNAVLVDVRTAAERTYVGVPQLDSGNEPLLIEWQSFPDGVANEAFLDELRSAGLEPGIELYFLCRSGARSAAAAAAATAAGLGPAYNITDGFEGPHGSDNQRNVAGWKVAGLPWRQG